jgi:hypothetical protein
VSHFFIQTSIKEVILPYKYIKLHLYGGYSFFTITRLGTSSKRFFKQLFNGFNEQNFIDKPRIIILKCVNSRIILLLKCVKVEG